MPFKSQKQKTERHRRTRWSFEVTLDFLNARAALYERLIAHGIPVLDARPGELGAQLVSRYLG
jgi:uncharacterized protein (DUF58 family)